MCKWHRTSLSLPSNCIKIWAEPWYWLTLYWDLLFREIWFVRNREIPFTSDRINRRVESWIIMWPAFNSLLQTNNTIFYCSPIHYSHHSLELHIFVHLYTEPPWAASFMTKVLIRSTYSYEKEDEDVHDELDGLRCFASWSRSFIRECHEEGSLHWWSNCVTEQRGET